MKKDWGFSALVEVAGKHDDEIQVGEVNPLRFDVGSEDVAVITGIK